MHHVVILRKASIKKGDDLLGSILDGTKTIESRWYVNRIVPWNKVKARDTLYLKGSGCPVTAKTTVSEVIQYENLTPETLKKIIGRYGNQIAPNTTTKEFEIWAKTQNKKRYCILVFLKNVEIVEPFEIDKTGYGNASAWIMVPSIEKIRRT